MRKGDEKLAYSRITQLITTCSTVKHHHPSKPTPTKNKKKVVLWQLNGVLQRHSVLWRTGKENSSPIFSDAYSHAVHPAEFLGSPATPYYFIGFILDCGNLFVIFFVFWKKKEEPPLLRWIWGLTKRLLKHHPPERERNVLSHVKGVFCHRVYPAFPTSTHTICVLSHTANMDQNGIPGVKLDIFPKRNTEQISNSRPRRKTCHLRWMSNANLDFCGRHYD